VKSSFLLFLICTIAGCGDPPASEVEVPPSRHVSGTQRSLEQLPPTPDYPQASDGYLVAVSDGDFVLDGKKRATAGVCSEQRILELYAEDETGGTAVMVQFPQGDAVGEYPIVLPDSALGDERSARIGVQVFEDRDAFGFQAIVGTVVVTSLGQRLSGHFASTVRDIQTNVLTRYVGVFTGIPVDILDRDYCDILRPEQISDTSNVDIAADSAVGQH